MKIKNDVDRFKIGDTSDWNSNEACLRSMRDLLDSANIFSLRGGMDAMIEWREVLEAFDRELSPYLTDEEEKALEEVRPKSSNQKAMSRTSQAMIPMVKRKLDKYERKLRLFYARKGFGITANKSSPENALRYERGY